MIRMASTPVIDPFMGSGTTGVACAELGIPFIGIELDEHWFNYSCNRIRQTIGQAQLFAPKPKTKASAKQPSLFNES